ncbi:bifunctional lysylphosphatidylglycerol flippase/synthetase MprF [Mesorhizobium sp. INR15]|uniref:bifunctional lysylphosphatidylglycerol flippase/synthetase MprF n=1 Tax=Mesorhizobium sp. INR15 TaxID=2654248 RepID=UPI0018969406|nr:bifunctional lysylphosphatidylglycerol flippase/synthetase MprF [Mesorhizobium sp. INR15]
MLRGPEARRQMFGFWSRYQHFALPAAGVVIAIVTVVVLQQFLSELSFDRVMVSASEIPAKHLMIALALTVVSFAAVAFYDVVAVETIAPGRIPKFVSASVGAAGYAISNALGFSLLTGGMLRYRIYAGEGIALSDIGRIIGTSWLAIWFAFTVMIALGLVLDPARTPFIDQIDPRLGLALGIVLILSIGFLVGWLSRGERTLTIGRFSIRLPNSRGALTQIVAGMVDVCAAAGTLYVLMPDTVTTSPAVFALVFVVATIIGIASHAPGGLGAFEASMIAGLGLGTNPDAIAALLAFRVIYTLLPFLIAIIGIVAFEIYVRHAHVSQRVLSAGRILEPLIPPLAAGATFLGGIMLLLSGSIPRAAERLDLLSDLLPLPFIEVSHLAASFVGIAMLILARGLARRLQQAWAASLILFILGAVFSIGKGLDWEDAIVLLGLSAILIAFRATFYRRPIEGAGPLSWGWLASVVSIVAISIWLGFFSYRDVDYSNQLFWQFAIDGDAPRFLRASIVILIATAAAALHTAVNRNAIDRKQRVEIPPAVSAIVASSNVTYAALAMLGDKQFLMSPDDRGFIMYARSGGSFIALGGPIGPIEGDTDLAWAFHDLADRSAVRTAFYGVQPGQLPMYLDMGLVALKLGEIARVDLMGFTLDGPRRQPLRYADRRAEKDGLIFEVIKANQVAPLLADLRQVSDAWLDMKAGSEKGFSLGYFENDYLSKFDMAVIRQQGRIIAFANLWGSADKSELTVDLMRHAPDAPKIVMDALLTRLLLHGKAQGYRWFNLGAAPLSGLSANRLASRWNRFGSFLYRRGQNLYRFDGLKAFKDKFDPVWTPHYFICPPGLDTVRSLFDVTALISGKPLELIRK